MEESYETFEEELGPPRADPPPQKPVRQIRRPEMYTARKVREETAPQQLRAEPKTLPREPSFPKTTSLPKAISIQNLSPGDRPWENVTLNRCLFVAITILVLTSGFQRLHESMRGQRIADEEEEESDLAVRRPGALRHRGQPAEPEVSLWEVMFWWLPDLDDDDDEEEEDDADEEGEVKRGKLKKVTPARASKSLRNKPLPDKKLMKQREGKLKERRAKRARDDETKDKKERDEAEEPDDKADDEEAEEEEEASVPKSKKSAEKKEKKKTQKD